jgi:hypothetical protein
MTAFICTALHAESLTPPPLSLKALIESEGNASTPILFITTPGADPSQARHWLVLTLFDLLVQIVSYCVSASPRPSRSSTRRADISQMQLVHDG